MRLFAPALLCALAAALAPVDGRSLREADAALARSVAQGDPRAFAALLASDACFSDGGRLLEGRDRVVDSWKELFLPTGPRLTWVPEVAELSASLDLGYTAGSYRLLTEDAAGHPVVHEGRYVTLWRREADGAFRAVADSPLRPPSDGLASGLVRTVFHRHASQAGDLVVDRKSVV